MAGRRVVIENRKTGEQYAVLPAAFREHYEDKGFRILHWEGGEAYEEQPAKAPRKRRSRAERRAAAATVSEPVEPVGPQPEPEG
jgi:hypothetical protein